MLRSFVALAVAVLCCPACLVVSTSPAYDDESIEWDAGLVGSWVAADDNSSMDVEASEWRSYRIEYAHPIETGILTGYVTSVGGEQYLDVMPTRGQDRGSFLVPVHVVLRLRLEGDRLELTPLSYDWFADRLRAKRAVAGLSVVKDQKENALIASPTRRLREWLRQQPASSPAFGAPAVFTRKK